jgi:hypothetical protein
MSRVCCTANQSWVSCFVSATCLAANAVTRPPSCQTMCFGSQAHNTWPRFAHSRIIEKVVSLYGLKSSSASAMKSMSIR